MNARSIGALIALLVVVAVSLTSLRLISFSFQEQSSPQVARTMPQPLQVAEKTDNNLGHVLRMGPPTPATQPMELEWQPNEIEQWQPDYGLRDEQRKLSETRRQAEQQQRIREAQARNVQARDAELTRGLEEQRKATEDWWKEEQARRLRASAQLEADLKRVQDDERRLGIRKPVEMRAQAEKQQPAAANTSPFSKGEGKVAAGRLQAEVKAPAPKREVAQASPVAAQPVARAPRALSTSDRDPPCFVTDMVSALLRSEERSKHAASKPASRMKVASAAPTAPAVRTASAPNPVIRGTTGTMPAKAAASGGSRSGWQVQALMQSN